ncbi:MAG: tagaturonate reductase [Candidatus Merdivicinus sp.]|jgi:tagaturonate reductase
MKTVAEQAVRKERPIRVAQFGEGNFLRAFADWMVDIANEKGLFDGDVAVIKPIAAGNFDRFTRQNGFYTVCLRGRQDGKVVDEPRVVSCVREFIDLYTDFAAFLALARQEQLQIVISNTTEAGIAYNGTDSFDDTPPASYPAKLTRFLYERYSAFHGDPAKGLVILPVELIEDNGKKLRSCVLSCAEDWKLEDGFFHWLKEGCVFASTLVDRIVTGYPAEAAEICEKLGYQDELLDVGEPFGLWVIESDRDISSVFPMDQAGLPVIFTADQRPYRERKVRILNGAHTSTVLAGFLTGLDTVGECMADPLIRTFMEHAVMQEIVPTVPLPREEAEAFAASVFERFENPFVRHELLSISLNSVSKWKARVLPSLRDSLAANGKLPALLTFSFAALLAFYTGTLTADGYTGNRGGNSYPIRDGADILAFFAEQSAKAAAEYVPAVCARTDFWGMDLNEIPGFADSVTSALDEIRQNGMKSAVSALFEREGIAWNK